jgi:hypothetical protein
VKRQEHSKADLAAFQFSYLILRSVEIFLLSLRIISGQEGYRLDHEFCEIDISSPDD